MVYFVRGGFWLSFGQVITTLAFVTQGIIFARFLSKETYGTYNYILSLVPLFSIPALSGINTALIRSVAHTMEGSFTKILRIRIILSLLGAFASLIIGLFYFHNHNIVLATSLLIIALFVSPLSVLGQYDALLQGRGNFKMSTIYSGIIQATTSFISILAVLISGNLFVILVAYFFPNVILDYLFLKKILKTHPPNHKIDPNALSYGLHLSIINLIASIANVLDRIFVFHFLGSIPLAIYSLAVAPPDQMKGFLANLNNLSVPRIAKIDTKLFKQNLKGYFIKLFIIGLIPVVTYILLAPTIFQVLFPLYKSSVIYSQVFALSLLNFAFTPVTSYLQSKRKIKEQYLINIIAPIFQILSMFLMILKWGLMGLIVARILSRYFGSLLSVYLYYIGDFDNN